MNQHLQKIHDFLQQAESLSAEEKATLAQAIRYTDAELTTKSTAVEEKNRALEIEAALEKVRSRSLAMHKSDELREVVKVVFERLQALDFALDGAAFIVTPGETGKNFNIWIGDDHAEYPSCFKTPWFNSPVITDIFDAIASGAELSLRTYSVAEKNSWFEYAFQHTDFKNLPDELKSLILAQENLTQCFVLAKNSGVGIHFHKRRPLSDNEIDILKRFSKVFEQAYIRFLDLQKAEEQVHESQIETALERVRSRTMGMQHSDDLREVIKLIFDQFIHLGLAINGAGFGMDYKEKDDWDIWAADSSYSFASLWHVPYFDHPYWNGWNDAKQSGVDAWATTLAFDEKNSFFEQFSKYFPGTAEETAEAMKLIYSAPGWTASNIFLKNVSLYIYRFSTVPFSDAENAILKRFGKVFEQIYTRFKDLKQAEEQAREAKIEAALEKIRSQSLAMHQSEELQSVINIVLEKFTELGVVFDGGAVIIIFNEGSKDTIHWIAVSGLSYSYCVRLPYINHPIITNIFTAKENGEELLTRYYTFKEKNAFWKAALAHSDYKHLADDIKKRILKSDSYGYSIALSKNSALLISSFSGRLFSDEENNLLKRFARVFEQAYTRFLDLQKAEAQTREAKIEIALERVRTRAMSMHKSQDIDAAVLVVFEELEKLDLEILRCGIGIIDKENQVGDIWTTVKLDGKSSVQVSGKEPMTIHPLMQGTYDAWLNQTDFLYDLEGDDLMKYYRAVSGTNFTLPESHSLIDENNGTKQYYYTPTFKTGNLYAFRESPFPDDAKSIMKRFASVLNLTFSRFLDLQKAEIQAREAIKQASLDRVRGEIASMRTTKDLERIIPLVWNELTILGIPFIRCGVFIVDEQAEVIHSHLSTPDGKAIAAFDLPFDAEGIGSDVLPAWRQKQIATVRWSAKEFADYTKRLVDQGAVAAEERYVIEHPDTSLNLHFLPFLQGMLYVGNTSPLTADETDLVQSLADAFSTAYTRYEDFKKLEAAKKQVEKTLTDLKAAQTKLIQSEKMASLGELTAGIAHEIQNPLNFVNNFSEVNRELLQELKEESKKPKAERDEQLEKDLIDDLIGNEEKINHHGKRAGSIVKGMLQHSRTSSNDRQLTDINALADEFMRLSYHGLRAKNKTFNADMVTLFDPNLPQIEVVAQDIGRVLLNLFNNAFYAVNERSKTAGPDYKPEVTVETFFLPLQGLGGVKVRDNGTGIPDAIKDKIMQPFFTTKPTGEGTGLGLSLTYDMVVKGHAGDISVDTKEGKFTEFTIQLPINKSV